MALAGATPAEVHAQQLADPSGPPVVTIDGPTVVIFWTIPDSVPDPEARTSVYAALDQQQTGMADSREALTALGIAEVHQPGRRFVLRRETGDELFVAPPDSSVVGYVFAAPGRQNRVLYRVQFPDALLAAARAWLEGGPQPSH